MARGPISESDKTDSQSDSFLNQGDYVIEHMFCQSIRKTLTVRTVKGRNKP